eukprot:353842-Chlamydomonas_euryale.AAC.2
MSRLVHEPDSGWLGQSARQTVSQPDSQLDSRLARQSVSQAGRQGLARKGQQTHTQKGQQTHGYVLGRRGRGQLQKHTQKGQLTHTQKWKGTVAETSRILATSRGLRNPGRAHLRWAAHKTHLGGAVGAGPMHATAGMRSARVCACVWLVLGGGLLCPPGSRWQCGWGSEGQCPPW